jgi:RNA polymerase sigma-70 factor (ECF subfamily)
MNPSEPNDAAQWIRDALVQFEGPLLQYATRLAGGDLESARDAVQDTFLRLCDQARGDVQARLKPWLFTVCRNLILDHHRKERRMNTMDEGAAHGLPSTELAPGAALERSETVSVVMQTLERLPEKQREVLRLKFQQGLSYKQIADVTGHSTGNVGFLVHHGIKGLRELLAGKPLEGFAQ